MTDDKKKHSGILYIPEGLAPELDEQGRRGLDEEILASLKSNPWVDELIQERLEEAKETGVYRHPCYIITPLEAQ